MGPAPPPRRNRPMRKLARLGWQFDFMRARHGNSLELKSNASSALQEYERRCTVLAETPSASGP